MEHTFDLPVLYKGQEQEYPARLIAFGYTYRFEVTLGEQVIVFERDDAQAFRAVDYQQPAAASIDPALLAAIIHSLEQLSGE